MNRKYRYLLTAAAALAAAGLLTYGSRNDFGLGRNMEIAVNMMRELSVGYVDPVDPDKLMLGAAQGMVRDLDPYTEFIPADEMPDFELMTTGKYGGVGSLIRKKGEWVIIAQPYKDSPADRAGLRIGDRILAIDGKEAKGFTTEQVSAALKGDPGTKVKVTVEHLDGSHRTVTLTRERIAIPSIPYAGRVADSIGYLRHSDFTEGSYEEMRAAIERLRQEGPLKGLILDYRSNGGGILQEAVKILSMFVPKGTEVVSTKGRTDQSKQTYRTASEPAFPDLPLVVLINGSTASAAEIVAGALQDLDRAASARGWSRAPVPWVITPCSSSPPPNITFPRAAASRPSTTRTRRTEPSAPCPIRSSANSPPAGAARSTTAAASCPTSPPSPNTSAVSPPRSMRWDSSTTSATNTCAATPRSPPTSRRSPSAMPTTPTSAHSWRTSTCLTNPIRAARSGSSAKRPRPTVSTKSSGR